MLEAVALSWAPGGAHGWGVFGANLLKELVRRGQPRPLVLSPVDRRLLDDADRTLLEPLVQEQERLAQRVAGARGMLLLPRVCVLHALGPDLAASPVSTRFRGEPNVGFSFFERVDFSADVVARSAWLDLVLAGSRWNAEELAALGLPRVGCVLQGVDTERFQPGPPSGRFGDRFVIFSGGKLELRKGQDLVLAAYRRFHARHPESLLVTVWMNPWPRIMADIACSPHVTGAPSAALPPAQAIDAWVSAQGVPEGAHMDLGWVPNAEMPALLRECHAAVFASRCEGGTNLVAMEAMATGLPCIVSANSGHLDILSEQRAYPLRRQTPVPFGPAGSAHWRESDVDEIVGALEAIHGDRAEALRRGRAARAFAEGLGWPAQTARLLATIEELAEVGAEPKYGVPAASPGLSLPRAVALHQEGRLEEAGTLYGAILAAQPDHFDALHLLGVLRHQQGHHEEAVARIGAALAIRPDSAEAQSNRGNALQALHRLEEALASYDRALDLRPDFVDAFRNRGLALRRLGRFAEALASYARALALAPNCVEALNERGITLDALGRHEEALASYAQALEIRPAYVEALTNRGNALHALCRHEEALASYDAALAIPPPLPETLTNRGIALHALDRYDDAIASYDAALALRPDHADALCNRGSALQRLNRHEEAIASYRGAIAAKPDCAEAHWFEGLVRLARGELEAGWPGMEWRWAAPSFTAARRGFGKPQWRGDEDLAGRTILLHAEQGFGDTLQFVRFLPLVARRGAKIVLEVQAPLVRLLECLGGAVQVVAAGEPLPRFDLHCPLMSLPFALGITLDTLPAAVPYLASSEECVSRWCDAIGGDGSLRVGLAWSGRPEHLNDHNRSMPFERLAPLLSQPGVRFVSLQTDVRPTDAEALARHRHVQRPGEAFSDFADAAAVVSRLDLVISVDTAAAHLAGALARPVWVLLPFSPDWRWMLEREDSPWYPTARLFRQPRAGDWKSVVARVGEALASFRHELTARAPTSLPRA